MENPLAGFGLTPEQKERRRGFIGGSDANIIMSGDPAKILNLWREKRGEPYEQEEVTLPMLIGTITEPLNLAWFSKQTGRQVSRRGEQLVSSRYPFMGVTLDGATVADDGSPAVIECKHVNEFRKAPDVISSYVPQISHQLIATGMKKGILAVLQGTGKWWSIEMELDMAYAMDLVRAERHFWACVQDGTPPVSEAAPPPVVAPAAVVAVQLREVDMTTGNAASEWKDLVAKYIEEAPFVKRREETDASIRGLIAEDVGKAYGDGLTASRRKDGAIVLKIDPPPRPKKSKSNQKEDANAA